MRRQRPCKALTFSLRTSLQSHMKNQAIALVANLLLCSQAISQESYTLQVMPSLGGTESLALGLNDFGDVVGEAELANGDKRAVIWSGGQIQDLGTFGGAASIAYDINNSGRVVGRATESGGFFEKAFGFRADPGDYELFKLQNLSIDFGNGAGFSVNEPGVVSGFSGGFDLTVAVTWSELGLPTALMPLPSALVEPIYSVWDGNDAGNFVGQSQRTDFDLGFTGFGATLWRSGGSPQYLGALGGTSSFARAINEEDQIVGFAATGGTPQFHAFLWENGSMTDLGDLGTQGPALFSSANDINEAGVIVGTGDTGSELHGFVWDGAMHDLNDLINDPMGFTIEEAHAVNDQGQIVGRCADASGQVSGFLLTPIGNANALPLVADTDSISLSAGGTQALLVKGGIPNAGAVYFILGSATGTSPGLPLGMGVELPLFADAYTTFTIKKWNSGPFTSTLGALSDLGRAQASISIPPGTDPSLAGLTLTHAFAVVDPQSFAARFASNPQALIFLP